MDWVPQVKAIVEEYCGKWGTRAIAYFLIACLIFIGVDWAHPGFKLVFDFFKSIQTPEYRELISSNWFSIIATGIIAAFASTFAFGIVHRLLIELAIVRMKRKATEIEIFFEEVKSVHEETKSLFKNDEARIEAWDKRSEEISAAVREQMTLLIEAHEAVKNAERKIGRRDGDREVPES